MSNFCYLKNVRRFLFFNLNFFYNFWFIFNFISFLTNEDFNFNGGKFTYEGVEYTINEIRDDVFEECLDITTKKLILPNCVKTTGNKAFKDVKPLKQLDLTNLDHVIKIDANPFSENGYLYNTKINTILIKDQPMKNQHSNEKYLSSIKDYIKIQ